MSNMFHIAIPILDLNKTRDFYEGVLGCKIGRSASTWIDFNFFGHQLTAHVHPKGVKPYFVFEETISGIPSNHFGAVLEWKDWNNLVDKLQSMDVHFLIEPRVMFEGEVGEQHSFFLRDPNGYAIEFKSFQDLNNVFKSE